MLIELHDCARGPGAQAMDSAHKFLRSYYCEPWTEPYLRGPKPVYTSIEVSLHIDKAEKQAPIGNLPSLGLQEPSKNG